jgi:hypothetical protein
VCFVRGGDALPDTTFIKQNFIISDFSEKKVLKNASLASNATCRGKRI